MNLGRIPRHVQWDVNLVADAVRIHGGILHGIGFLYVSFLGKTEETVKSKILRKCEGRGSERGVKKMLLPEAREGKYSCFEFANGVESWKALPSS